MPINKVDALYYHILCIFVLGVVTLLVFHIPLLTHTIPLHTDGQYMTFPAIAYFKRWALKGSYPVWWVTDSICGNMADTGSVDPAWLIFAPLFLFLKLEWAWFLLILLKFFLAGLCMYLYLVRMTRHQGASLFGALLFMRAEGFVDSLDEPQTQFFFFPLILLSLEQALETSKMRYILLTALLSTFFFIGSHVNYPIYLIPLAIFYFVIRAVQKQISQSRLSLRPFIYGIVLVTLFVAWSWFRPYMLAVVGTQSTRQTVEYQPPLLVSPLSFLTIIFPDLFKGGDVQFPHMYDRMLQGFSSLFLHTKLRFIEIWYPGLFAAFFLCCAWSARKKVPWTFAPWVALFGFLFYVLGGEMLLLPLIGKIRLVNLIQNTQRISVVSMVLVPILSAAGFLVCIQSSSDGENDSSLFFKWLKRFSLFLAAVFFLFVLKDVVMLAIEYFGRATLANQILEFIREQSHYQQPETFYLKRIEEFLAWLKSWAGWRSPAVFLPFLLNAAGASLYWMWRARRRSSVAVGILFFSLVIFDGFVAHPPPLNELVPHGGAYPSNPTIVFLQKDKSLFRFFSLKPRGEPAFPWGHGQFLPADTHLVYGLASVHGYQAITPKRYQEVFQLLAQTDSLDTIRLHDAYRYEKKLVDFLNVKYMVVRQPEKLASQTPVFEDAFYRVYENSDFFPRAFLVPESIVVANQNQSLDHLKNGELNLRRTVLLEGPGAPAIKSTPLNQLDRLTLQTYSPHEIVLDVNSGDNRILVLTDTYHPAWKCFIGGRQVPIYIANHAFRGVYLKPGHHIVRFQLEPFPYSLYGLGVIASLCLALLVFLYYRQKDKT